MKPLFDTVSVRCSKLTTRAYSTSFSLGIYFLARRYHNPIYSIYGFVRFADEIVDSFIDYDKVYLLQKFRQDTVEALRDKISLNPILNSFQNVVHQYSIEWELIDTFLRSMEMDLQQHHYDTERYKEYILGSAEVVGLMCLRVFCKGDDEMYQRLKPAAMSLGSAFQKINFLRDAHTDFLLLGRTYFPGVVMSNFEESNKKNIEADIEQDFQIALEGIRQLPHGARRGVYLAYTYYYQLFQKIRALSAPAILHERIRVSGLHKTALMIVSLIRYQLNRI